MDIPAGQFKARCLKLLDEVQQQRKEIVVTKRGRPVAKLVPVDEPSPVRLFGYLKDSVVVTGDILAPIADDWGVDHD